MDKYTEQDYVSKLLPEALAQVIIWEDLKSSEYMELLHTLWQDSREFLTVQTSEKDFTLSVMDQIDYYSNVQEYQEDLQSINENAITEEGKLQLDNFSMGVYYNTYLVRAYCVIRNGATVSVRELFSYLLYERRTKLALWYVDTLCNNFNIRITQNGQPVNLKTAKLDSIVDIERIRQ